ncbi:MAG: hypothetical protein KF752_05465 [Pirellulaceae bacterium]|nr:hypothetical protein [Pirellulaceae bacterium]
MSTEVSLVAHPVTWKTLLNSRNQAATTLLEACLASPIAALRHQCLRLLCSRDSEQANQSILLNWKHYDHHDLLYLHEQSTKFFAAARSLLSFGDHDQQVLALVVISELNLSDSVDVVLEFALNAEHSLHQPAASCLLSMCQRLGRQGRSGSLESCPVRSLLIQKLHAHILTNCQSSLLMQAWLTVAHWEDSQMRSLLMDPSHPAYLRMLTHLAATDDPAALQLLAGYFARPTTPQGILNLIVEHTNPLLLVEMAKLVGDEALDSTLRRLLTVPELACIPQVNLAELKLNRAAERRLLLMLAASRDDIAWTLVSCVCLSSGNQVDTRQLAAEMLMWCKRPALETLVRWLQADSVLPEERQVLTRAVQAILDWLRSPSKLLRRSATKFFEEFSLDSLFRQIQHWPAQLCRFMAELVARVDHDVPEQLRQQLSSPSRQRRFATLQVIEWLHCEELIPDVLASLSSESHLENRVRAIDALSILSEHALDQVMPELLLDPSTDIVDAANRALRRIGRRHHVQTSSSATSGEPSHAVG